MKKRIFVLVCVHETEHGIDNYISLHPSSRRALDWAKIVQKQCEYDPNNYGEYFNADYQEHVIDMDLFTDYAEEE